MSTQDKFEGILRQIHHLMAEGDTVSGDPDKVIVEKKEVFAILEELNLAVNEMKEEYEATVQAREMAEKRIEKKGKEMIDHVSRQADDIYAASLIYTEDALNKIYHLMEDAIDASQKIWKRTSQDMEKEQRKIKEDQLELHEQLQDFKDANKYLAILEECNKEREKQEKEAATPEKKIQNEAKHYTISAKPEIKVNAAYFERREQKHKEESEENFDIPEIKVDLDAEYFKWKEGESQKQEEKSSRRKVLTKLKRELKSLMER